MRVLKNHTKAVKTALESGPYAGQDELLEAVALAVLTAYDEKIRYVIATSEGTAFGPYASRDTAYKVIEKGHCATRAGTQAMVLPMFNAPRGRAIVDPIRKVSPKWDQLVLWDVTGDV